MSDWNWCQRCANKDKSATVVSVCQVCRSVDGGEEEPTGFVHIPIVRGVGKESPTKNKFKAILDPMADLLQRKNKDYGSSYDLIRSEFGEISFLIRLSDKFNRLKTLTKQSPEVVSESVEDTIRDIIGYCTLELAYREKDKPQCP